MKAKALAIAAVIAVSSAQPAHAVDLAGSGASFVVPLVEACKAGFAKKSGHSFVYTSTGSGTGKNNSDNKIGDFWFSDSAHTGANKRSTIFHAPIVAAPIAVLVNLPAKKDIYLSSATVAKIFSGEITKWNDPQIISDNQKRTIKTPVYKTKQEVVTVGGKKVTKTVPVLDKNGKPTPLKTTTPLIPGGVMGTTGINPTIAGTVTLSLGSTTSAAIKPGKYFYDLLLNSPTGTTTRVVEGTALVKKSVTR